MINNHIVVDVLILSGMNWYNGCKNAALYVDGVRPGMLDHFI
jgi:hypothetical protein